MLSSIRDIDWNTSIKDKLEGNGVKLAIPACNVGEREQLNRVFSVCSKEMPPSRGFIHSAMVIRVSYHEICETG